MSWHPKVKISRRQALKTKAKPVVKESIEDKIKKIETRIKAVEIKKGVVK